MITDNNFYIYLHIKKGCGSPFYVGKGKKDRSTFTYNRSKFWDNIVNKYGFDVILLEENLTEEISLEREVYWINRIGRRDLGTGPLINLTSGGEGTSGRVVSDITRKKLSDSNKGKVVSDETRKKLSVAMKKRLKINPLVGPKNGMYGKVQPKEWRENHSKMMLSENNPKSKTILDTETGIYYYCIREVSEAYNINYSTLRSGINTNKFNRFKKI